MSRVTASRFDQGTAYVTFDGHRSDDFRPWVYKTTDFGETWRSIAADLPGDEPVYVITEDVKNPEPSLRRYRVRRLRHGVRRRELVAPHGGHAHRGRSRPRGAP